MLYGNVVDAIGHTPLVRLAHPERDDVQLYGKLEFQNIFAMKDRVARNIITAARRRGELLPGSPIIESSSGTMALGVALVGRSLGHPVHIVTDPRIDPITLAKLDALGCTVRIVEAMTGAGWQSARLELLREMLQSLPGAFWPEQYTNPDNPGAYRQLAAELRDDLSEFDLLVGATGSGGSLCGTSRALRASGMSGLHVVGVDCVGSSMFGQPDRPQRAQSGLGNSLLPANLDRRAFDEIHWLNDREAFDATRRLAAEQCLFAGNTSGSVYAVMVDVARRAAPGTRIVGILPDRGDRYVDSVFSDDYWSARGIDALDMSPRSIQIFSGEEARTWSRTTDPIDTGRQRMLFIEANTTGTGVQAINVAAEAGLIPVILCADPTRYEVPSGCEVVVCDTNDLAALRRLIMDRYRRDELAGVTTTSDFYVPTTAAVADWLGAPGVSESAAHTCRNKHLTRRALRTAGLAQPDVVEVRPDDDVATLLGSLDYPRVVKPSDESGSEGVRLVHDAVSASRWVAEALERSRNARGQLSARVVLVESVLDGPEVSVETFGTGGTVQVVGITDKFLGGGDTFVEVGHRFPTNLPPETAAEVVDVVRQALKAVDLVDGPAHTEVRLTSTGPVVVEINPRLAGGRIPDLVRAALGIDLLAAQIAYASGNPVDLTPRRESHAGIIFLTAPGAGMLEDVGGLDSARKVPGVVSIEITKGPGTTVVPPSQALHRLGSIIAVGSNRTDVNSSLDEAMEEINVNVSEPDHHV